VNTPFAHFFDQCHILPADMRVLLRHAGMGLYYAGRKHWVGDPDSALDLGSIEQAAERSREEFFEEMDIVVTHDDPTCELVLPVRRKRPADAEPLRAAA
jgi:hypothetical protein